MAKVVDRVYEDLRRELMAGTYPPGQWLREEDLAETKGVSRTPVREALRRLHSDGLVELVPNRGAQVPRTDPSAVDDAFDIRIGLESFVARRAAATGRQLARVLRPICDAMEQQIEIDQSPEARDLEIRQMNVRFHETMQFAVGCRLVAPVANLIEVAVARQAVELSPEERQRSFVQHRELIAAIEAQDEDWAEAAIRTHLLAERAAWRRAVA